MTYEERKQQTCKECRLHGACAYVTRDLQDDCPELQYIMNGWELGQEDTIKSLWKDAQGDDLPEIDREVIALQGRRVVFAHRPNPNGYNYKDADTLEVEHIEIQTYNKGGWNIPDVKYWLDVELPEGVE